MRSELLTPPGLLLLTGLVLPSVVGFSLCGWRNQSENGNLLRCRGRSVDNTVIVVNSAEALTVSAPFLSSNDIALPSLRGMYVVCVHWYPGLHLFNITYGLSTFYDTGNQSRRSNGTGDQSLRGDDSAHSPPTCNSAFSLINVTFNGERKGNSCHYEYQVGGQGNDAKLLEQEMSQIGDYLQRKKPSVDGRRLRGWIDEALSRVHIDGKSQHFGSGAVRAAVYELDTSDVLSSLPQTLGVSLSLPEHLLQKEPNGTAKRLHVVRIQGAAIFQRDANLSVLGDQVLGVSLQDTSVSNLPEEVVIGFPHQPTQDSGSPLCVFWDESLEDWSTAGCRTVMAEHQIECRCNHLTYFAVLMQISSQVISEVHLVSLTAISFAGCAISAMSCVFTIVWICCSRKNQANPTLQIHLHLLVALFLLDVTFVASALLSAVEDVLVCRFSAIALHLFLLCLFTWMAIEGFNLYRLVVKVFDSPAITIGRLAVLGWGVPVLLVALVLLVDPSYYGIYYITVNRPTPHSSRAAMCWLTEPIVHQVLNLGFFAGVLLFNVCMLVAMTRRVLRLSPHSRQEQVRHCVTLLGLSCMLGLSWGLAFFSFGVFYLPIQYAFSILNALQGLFIFLWYCVLSQPHGKYTPRSTDSTSATPGSPPPDQSLSSDRLLT